MLGLLPRIQPTSHPGAVRSSLAGCVWYPPRTVALHAAQAMGAALQQCACSLPELQRSRLGQLGACQLCACTPPTPATRSPTAAPLTHRDDVPSTGMLGIPTNCGTAGLQPHFHGNWNGQHLASKGARQTAPLPPMASPRAELSCHAWHSSLIRTQTNAAVAAAAPGTEPTAAPPLSREVAELAAVLGAAGAGSSSRRQPADRLRRRQPADRWRRRHSAEKLRNSQRCSERPSKAARPVANGGDVHDFSCTLT